MPEQATWDLYYPTRTAEEERTFRHHFETLRLDKNVHTVLATEEARVPLVMRMRVVFSEGFTRPDTVDLRHIHALYGQALVGPVVEAMNQFQQLLLEIPRMMGMASSEVLARMREVSPAVIRMPVLALPSVAKVTLPDWVQAGGTYRALDGTIATLASVRVTPEGTWVDLKYDVDPPEYATSWPLDEFITRFEPYKRPKPARTAWLRVLEDSDD